MKSTFLLSILLLFALSAFSQKKTSDNKQAQKAYAIANQNISYKFYDKALASLKEAVSLDEKFTAAFQQMADIYRKLSDPKNAKINYLKVIEIDPEFLPLTYYGLAESELNTGDYSNALNHFEKYISYPGLSETSKKTVLKYIEDCRFSLEAIKNPVNFKPVNLGNSINTKEQEYLPVVTADEETLIFTRQANRNEDFYRSIKKDGSWTISENLSRNINTAIYNEGAQSISPDGLYMFFTICNRPDGLGRCDIYLSKRDGKNWSTPFNIGAPINTPGWESQPSISADGKTLYFVSTRPGGVGGYDIYKSDLKEGGSWSVPENLGPNVNTVYDEQSPFIHPDDETLYFSSNGWPGLGNKDLFISRKNSKNKTWQKPQNLGYPINTFGEESGLIISSNGKTAFFASDNKQGFGGLDIYSFDLPANLRPLEVTYVKGSVFDKTSKKVLDAKVQIINLSSNTSVYNEISDVETGEFMATMAAGKTYALNVSKDGYLFYSKNFSLKNSELNKPYNIQIPLQKIEVGGMVTLNNIFFETNKFYLLPESKVELQDLINFLNDNPKISVEIAGHTDNLGDEKMNLTLSESRAKTVYNYLINNKISATRLTYKGYGKSKPVADNSTEEGRKNNRRTEFKITKN
ncbi:OmpA family protein [Daejeonella oryzae]|uniref:OmpA family protein n=1 Tax=Daejeonella oryzae TaxID=1122943 RepID=UPI00040F7A30|nr:OmpA family protein [Daejeonella oryzae]